MRGSAVRLYVWENSLSTVCLWQEIRYKMKSKKVLWLGFSHRRRKKKNPCIPNYANTMQTGVITYLLRKFQLPHFALRKSWDSKRECLSTVQSC